MTPLDIWAGSAAAIAGSAMAIRARMLRPHNLAWTQAPPAVWVALSVLATGLLVNAYLIFFAGARAVPREAAVYTLLAVCSVIMLWNLNRNGRQAEVERKRIAGEVKLAMELSGRPARYPGERPG